MTNKPDDIVKELRSVFGFGWQCGEPLKDKGSYCRCPCGCSQPSEADEDGMTISQPEILRRAADEIERLRHDLDGARLAYRGAGYDRDRMRAERDEARREWCIQSIQAQTGNRAPLDVLARKLAEDIRGWDCFKEDTNG